MKNLAILFGMIALMGCKSTHKTSQSTQTTNTETIRHTTEVVTLPTSNTVMLPAQIPPSRYKVGTSTIIIEPTIGGLSSLTIETPEYVSRIDSVFVGSESVSETSESELQIRYKVPKWVWYLLVASFAALIWAYRGVLMKLIRGISGLPPL